MAFHLGARGMRGNESSQKGLQLKKLTGPKRRVCSKDDPHTGGTQQSDGPLPSSPKPNVHASWHFNEDKASHVAQ